VAFSDTDFHRADVAPSRAHDAGLRRHDEPRRKPWGGGIVTISHSVGERKLMDTSW
jgi:hypothetical protein